MVHLRRLRLYPNGGLGELHPAVPRVAVAAAEFEVQYLSELIEDFKNGVLYELGNPNDLAEKIKCILSDNDLKIMLQINAKFFVEKVFNINKTIRLEEQLYLNLINGS